MKNFIKIFFRVEDDIDFNCLDKCPFGENKKCGSFACVKCKHCIGSGKMHVWDLSKERGLAFNQGYIICSRVYEKFTFKMKVMRIMHLIKLKIQK